MIRERAGTNLKPLLQSNPNTSLLTVTEAHFDSVSDTPMQGEGTHLCSAKLLTSVTCRSRLSDDLQQLFAQGLTIQLPRSKIAKDGPFTGFGFARDVFQKKKALRPFSSSTVGRWAGELLKRQRSWAT